MRAPFNFTWLSVMIAGALADLYTTQIGLDSGKFIEGNPLGQNELVRWLLKGISLLACARFADWASYKGLDGHAKLVRWSHVVCNFGPALWNARLLMMTLT